MFERSCILNLFSLGKSSENSKVTFGYFYDWDSGGEFKAVYKHRAGQIDVNLRRTEKGYVHKDVTLPGFIEWLKEKQ